MAGTVLSEVASKILDESLKTKSGETVTIETWDTGTALAREVAKQARRRGCTPIVISEDEGVFLDGIRKAPKGTIGTMGRHEYALLSATDAYVFIPGPPIGAYYSKVTRAEYTEATRYNPSWYDAAQKSKIRGVRLNYGYVGKDLAKLLKKKEADIVASQLRGVLVDFGEVGEKGAKISSRLREGARATLTSEAGDLDFVLMGDRVVEDGMVSSEDVAKGDNVAYLPPGMVTQEVDPRSADGIVRLSPSLTRLGVAETVELEFRRGKLVRWTSRKPAPMIDGLVKAVEEGKRALTLVTVGLNDRLPYGNGVDRFVSGSVSIAGFGFVGVLRKGTLKVDQVAVVTGGRLQTWPR